jgi:AcrR family transcriptional regulator
MTSRKQHVIKMAHQLFIDKGYQSTSIQDILDFSGISKGTFYNYFSSKNELFMALFSMIQEKLEKDRNELLMGQDSSNIEIFIKQIEFHMKMNRTNNLSMILEEVNFSNDVELKQFIKTIQLKTLRWYYQRFLDIFDESHKPYLLDCAIMFMGMLHQNLKYHDMAYDSNVSIHRVVSYSVERVVKMVKEVAEVGNQMIQPELLVRWLPEDYKNSGQAFQHELCHTILILKNNLNKKEQMKYNELLDFIQDELTHSKEPRKFLLESAMLSLKEGQALFEESQLLNLQQLVNGYYVQN